MGGQAPTPCYNQEMPHTQETGFTSIYRKLGVTELKTTIHPSIQTIRDLIRKSVQKYGKNDCIGQIKVDQGQDSSGQPIEVRSIRNYTYEQIYETSLCLGRSLYHNKLYFDEPVHEMKLIGIYAKNRCEWFVADWACVLFGLTTVPLYDTLGTENLTFCLKQTEMKTLFVTSQTLQTLVKLNDRGALTTVVSFEPLKPEIITQVQSLNIKILYYLDLIEEGRKLSHINNNQISIESTDCYTFSYTSGTTGPPKGAMLSHQNLLSFLASMDAHADLDFGQGDTYLSYLPLPHIMERGLSLAMFQKGTYLVISSGDMLKLKDDCKISKPTVLISVPRICNKIVDTIKGKIEVAEGLKGCIAQRALSSKVSTANDQGKYSSCLYDCVVFSKIRAEFGGAIRLMACGSAPLTPETYSHMKAIMCCPLIEGYGQTESSAAVLYSRAYDRHYGVLSEISECTELKLADIPEMKYTSKDTDSEGRPSPRGEILARGPQIFIGYYKAPDITRQTITSDGWLRTGDVGQIMPGSLGFRIIDRKKNIFKLQQGQYVAPDKVENVYMKCSLITEIFLHGDSKQNYAVAVTVPNKDKLLELASKKGLNGTFQELCNSKEMRSIVLAELNSFGKKEGLYGFELAKNIKLQTESFLNRKILTNTMKLIRYEARTIYAADIQKMYKEGELAQPK